MVKEALLDHAPAIAHRMPAEEGDAEGYERLLRSRIKPQRDRKLALLLSHGTDPSRSAGQFRRAPTNRVPDFFCSRHLDSLVVATHLLETAEQHRLHRFPIARGHHCRGLARR